MDINKANKHFQKLSNFYKTVSSDGNLNSIEKDLLKNYILSFYEAVCSDEVTNGAAERVVATKEPIKAVEKIAEPVKETVLTPPPAQEKKPAVKVEPAIKAEPAVATAVAPKAKLNGLSEEAEALLSIEVGSELSDKLSNTAIKDIGKSMSINEKIFTIQELFSGDQTAFDECMQKLNGFKNIEAAKAYLAENIVGNHNWSDEAKFKKVQTLMRLVHRKYA